MKHFVYALDVATCVMRSELIGVARLLMSFRHRVVLAPLKPGPQKLVERQLLNRLSPLSNTVLMDSVSTTVKAIVTKLQMNLVNLKTATLALMKELSGDEKTKARSILARIIESLGAA